jgi:aspartate kinase
MKALVNPPQPRADAPPVVMKFGGSSVADSEHIRRVARIVATRATDQRVVVVVSAMGKSTNGLVEQARELCPEPPARELDMLLTTGERHCMALVAMAICEQGHSAISLTGSQCGIITNHEHGRARIVELRPFRILDELAAGHIVIVGGFQGVSYKREVTTLGRGGSDTTAVALAAALGADCEIYSDVDGIYTADPRQVKDARRIDEIPHDEMEALARAGAKVLHGEALRLAHEHDVVIYTRSTADADRGSGGQSIVRRTRAESKGVRSVAADAAVSALRLQISGSHDDATRIMGECLGPLGLLYLSIESTGCRGLLSETRRDDLGALREAVDGLAQRLAALPGIDAAKVEIREDLGLVTCVGTGLEQDSCAFETALGALAEIGVAPQGIHTDSHSLSFSVPRSSVDTATRALHASMIISR